MSEQTQRSSLGRGLAALFGEEGEEYAALDRVRATKDVPVEHLHPNSRQPRTRFEEARLNELADSIRANGVLQPILVRRHPKRPAEFEIVAGERRWRAAQLAQVHHVPVVIREIDDGQALELALVENLQREDLGALEEADAYHHLMESFDYTQDALAKSVGRSRSHIANTLRLRGLPEAVKALLGSGALSAGHARALLGASHPEAIAHRAVSRHLSVRQVERLVQQSKAGPSGRRPGGKSGKPSAKPVKDLDTIALEQDLSAMLGLRVSINFGGQGGSLTIHYQALEQLDDVLRRLNQAPGPAFA
jgi:ParB family chromosome partitioning protein